MGWVTMRTNLQIHFMHRHRYDTVVILEEGNCPHPCCLACEMIIPWETLNCHNHATALCAWGSERKRRWLAKEEDQSGEVTPFRDFNRTLETLFSFKYLWRLLMATKNDWPEFIDNAWKAKNRLSCLAQILGKKVADNWMSGRFYVAVV